MISPRDDIYNRVNHGINLNATIYFRDILVRSRLTMWNQTLRNLSQHLPPPPPPPPAAPPPGGRGGGAPPPPPPAAFGHGGGGGGGVFYPSVTEV